MRIGIVDLDTAHPQRWVPIERDLGHEIVGVWDAGDVHPPEYVEQFIEDHDIPCVFPSIETMVGEVDCAVIHSADWDVHVDRARPFIEAQKSVLIDKPMAGKVADLAQIQQWADAGARIAGGSALRFCDEIVDWLALPVGERGTPHTVLCGCSVDEFNYGSHAYALLTGLLGPGVERVQHLAGGVQHKVRIDWQDHRHLGLLVVGQAERRFPFFTTIVTEKGVWQFHVDESKLDRALLEVTLPYLSGEIPLPPAPVADLLEAKYCALAARRSMMEGGRFVELDELTAHDDGFDGAAFAAGLRAALYPDA